MENLTLDNFSHQMEVQLRKVICDHLKSLYPSPVEVLQTIDDISLDWTDEGGEFSAKFLNGDGFVILKNEFSTDSEEKIIPGLRGLHSFGHYLKKDHYNSGIYCINISNPTPKRGHLYWEEIVSKILLRLNNEYEVKYTTKEHWDKLKFGLGNVTYTSVTSGDNQRLVVAPIESLKTELSKISNLEFKFRVAAKNNPKS